MTAPQYPAQPGYPPAPPQPGYAAQPPAPQYYQQPAAPQYYQQPAAPAYAQPQAPQYPQGYGQPQQPQAPQAPPVQLAAGSLDAYYSQPASGGGAGLKFPDNGSAHFVIVARTMTDADVEQQTDPADRTRALFFKDGRPKFVLKVPLNVASTVSEDGKSQWYCGGAARDDLGRAMAAVGAPTGPPEAGAAVYIVRTGQRAAGAFKVNTWNVQYWRPGPEAQAMAAQYGILYPDLSAVAQPTPAPAPAPVAQAPAPVAQPQVPQQMAPPPQQMAPPPAAPPVPQQAQAPAPTPPPPPAAPGTQALTPEQQQLLASLGAAPPQG